jgi:hypothetical protein
VKARCEACGVEGELRFVVAVAGAGAGIDVTCDACGARTFVPAGAAGAQGAAATQGAPSEPATVRPKEGEQECPKCGEVQPAASACRRCGLVFVRWKGGAGEAGGEDAEAARLWEAVEVSWTDAARHDAFIAHCQRTQQFPLAAGRYRVAASGARGANDPFVVRSLERIEKLALTTLELSAQRERGAAGASGPLPYRNTMMALVALVALVALALVWTMLRQQQRAERQLREPEGVQPVQPVQPVQK